MRTTINNIAKRSDNFEHLVKKHPCFHGEAHAKYGRIHLPVSPACNIQCRFCQRGFNKCEERPGVSRGIVSPEQAIGLIEKALTLCPEITVVGIAGPGDTLATYHALRTFALVQQYYPHLLKCLSTNGLLLAERSEDIAEVHVNSVTVTVNADTAETLTRIVSHVQSHDKRLIGIGAAETLLAAQLAGIEAVARHGVVVKINTVLIPGVNDHEIEAIARKTSAQGASIMNIIPLIPQHEMADIAAPSCQLLNTARAQAEPYLMVFRHCKQCRADACGIPGKEIDLAEQLYEHAPMTFSHG
jgi:nitrogen fixation protein NifB